MKKLGEISNIAKTVTIWMLIIMSVVGIVGIFLGGVVFNMPAYITLLEVLKDYWIPLVVSIGGNSAVTKVAESIKGNKDGKGKNELTSKDEKPVDECEELL